MLLSVIWTTSPTFRLQFSCFYFLRSRRDVTYSFVHFSQKWIVRLCKRAHFLTGVASLASSIVSHLRTRTLSLSGSDSSFPPTHKWAGVKIVCSLGSPDSGKIERQLRLISIWQNSVVNSSNGNILLHITFRRCCFGRLTADAHRPSKCGALGGMKFQMIKRPAARFVKNLHVRPSRLQLRDLCSGSNKVASIVAVNCLRASSSGNESSHGCGTCWCCHVKQNRRRVPYMTLQHSVPIFDI